MPPTSEGATAEEAVRAANPWLAMAGVHDQHDIAVEQNHGLFLE